VKRNISLKCAMGFGKSRSGILPFGDEVVKRWSGGPMEGEEMNVGERYPGFCWVIDWSKCRCFYIVMCEMEDLSLKTTRSGETYKDKSG
jgi:hypothetical protein